jgi:hypothetical protein
VARVLNVPQKPLYRQVEQALSALRRRLQDEGVSPGTAGHLLDRGRLAGHVRLASAFPQESAGEGPSR